jgi:hypothetical protein
METDVADAGLELKTACAEKVFAPVKVWAFSSNATVPVRAGSVTVPDAVADAFSVVVPLEEPARISVPELKVFAPVLVCVEAKIILPAPAAVHDKFPLASLLSICPAVGAVVGQ